MARKDVTDVMVIEAYLQRAVTGEPVLRILMLRTGEPEKVIWRALERACSRNLIDYGTSLRVAWVTDEGREYLNKMKNVE